MNTSQDCDAHVTGVTYTSQVYPTRHRCILHVTGVSYTQDLPLLQAVSEQLGTAGMQ